MSKKCPIYNSTNACNENPDCLFRRQGGCAIILGLEIDIENEKRLKDLQDQLSILDHNVRLIAQAMNQR